MYIFIFFRNPIALSNQLPFADPKKKNDLDSSQNDFPVSTTHIHTWVYTHLHISKYMHIGVAPCDVDQIELLIWGSGFYFDSVTLLLKSFDFDWWVLFD